VDRAAVKLVAAQPHGVGVEIEHRGWEILGAGADAWRERNYAAWGTLLPRYRDALNT
jgi:hypothetical protein